jgi:colicin import membrane protein
MNELTTVQELEVKAKEEGKGLELDTIGAMQAKYLPHFKRLDELLEKAKGVKPSEPKKASALRKEVKACRVAGDKDRVEMKKSALLYGRAVDGIYNLLLARATMLEKTMEEIEKAEEIAEAKRVAELRAIRWHQIGQYADPVHYADLGMMDEAAYQGLLKRAKDAHEAQQAAEAQAAKDRAEKAAQEQQERAEREAAQAAERERLRAENERLAAEAAENRKQAEAAAKVAAEERAKREKAEAEQRAKDASEKAAAAKKLAAEAQAAKKAAAAPDRAKLLEFMTRIEALELPDFKDNQLKHRVSIIIADAALAISLEADQL